MSFYYDFYDDVIYGPPRSETDDPVFVCLAVYLSAFLSLFVCLCDRLYRLCAHLSV